jgi:hypothetical protein
MFYSIGIIATIAAQPQKAMGLSHIAANNYSRLTHSYRRLSLDGVQCSLTAGSLTSLLPTPPPSSQLHSTPPFLGGTTTITPTQHAWSDLTASILRSIHCPVCVSSILRRRFSITPRHLVEAPEQSKIWSCTAHLAQSPSFLKPPSKFFQLILQIYSRQDGHTRYVQV